MFEAEQKTIEAKIKDFSQRRGIPLADLKWQPIPFNGEWGISTSFFQTAANEARSGKGPGNLSRSGPRKSPSRSGAEIGSVQGISHVEAVKGYLNLYFSTEEYASRVVEHDPGTGRRFRPREQKSERVMVEYAQPNTHHSFHIGHARNAIAG